MLGELLPEVMFLDLPIREMEGSLDIVLGNVLELFDTTTSEELLAINLGLDIPSVL